MAPIPGERTSPEPSIAEAVEEAELARAPGDRPPGTAVERWYARLAPPVPISLGAALGANARYVVGLWSVAHWPGIFPWGTLLINVTGSLVIGFYLALFAERFSGRATTRLFVVTGFLGSYTTFSTFSYETVTLAQRGAVGPALLYVLASLLLGLAAVAAGRRAARRR